MSTDRDLMDAILDSPDDDIPRLVYADWLEEHGQPARAEFIRVECEAARTDRDSPTYPLLLRRSDRLRAAHAANWFGPLVDGTTVDHIVTRRGFIDVVVLSPDGYADHAELIADHAPLLRGVHASAGGDWRRFFAALGASAIRELSFAEGVFTEYAAEELAACDTVDGLTSLRLDSQPLGSEGMAAVAAAPLWDLERLSASESEVGDAGAEEVFANEAFKNLRDLDLSANGLSDTACFALARASGFGPLEQLVLSDNQITAEGVAALAAAPHLAGLRNLNLYSNPIGQAGGRAILSSRHWGGLKEINLVGCGVGVEVVRDLRWVYGEKAVKA